MHTSDIDRLNSLGQSRRPFVALISYLGDEVLIFPEDELADGQLYFDSPLLTYNPLPDTHQPIKLQIRNSDKARYLENLKQAIRYIKDGHSYLLNFTDSTTVSTEHSLAEIFQASRALFKLYLADEFVCFSPERFVQISEDRIHTYPMKGTIDADLPDAEQTLLADLKETTEHNTIVDLLRNDLSMVAEDVIVENYRYITHIQSPDKNILQASSHISGQLDTHWRMHIGDILDKLLPAGSISGAPKKRTLEIIQELESHQRGYYTGVAVFYDGEKLDSAVMIRFLEPTDTPGQYTYKSGGGITALSDPESEYQEMLQKIYVPIF